MNKTCPFKCTAHYAAIECVDKCVLYDGNGCLIKQALKTYINNHKPIKASIFKPYDKDDPMEGLRIIS